MNAKACLVLHLTRDMKGNKKGFCNPISNNWKTRGKCEATAEWSREHSDKGVTKCRGTDAVFALDFSGKTCFGNFRFPRSVGKSGASKTYPWYKNISLGNIYANQTHVKALDLMGCTRECWESWLMSLQGLSWLSSKRHSYWEGFLRTRKKQLLSSRRKRRKIQELQLSWFHLDPTEGKGASNSGNNFQIY